MKKQLPVMAIETTCNFVLKPFSVYCVLFFFWSCGVHKNIDAPFYKDSYSEFRTEINDSLSLCHNFNDSVTCIRNLAHTFYRCGRKSSDWQALGYENAWEWSSYEWFTKFNNDSISTKCGGAASFLSSLYKDYGFNSFNISIGTADTSDHNGHIQVVVSNNKDCCPDLYDLFIMDPMFNFHYEANGKLQSIGNMLDLIASYSEDSLTLVSVKRNALHLQNSRVINPFSPEIKKEPTNTVYRSKNPHSKYIVSAPRTIDRYLKGSFKTLYEDIIHQQGLNVDLNDPANFKYTVLAIREIYSTCCPSKIEQMYQKKRDLTINKLH